MIQHALLMDMEARSEAFRRERQIAKLADALASKSSHLSYSLLALSLNEEPCCNFRDALKRFVRSKTAHLPTDDLLGSFRALMDSFRERVAEIYERSPEG